MGRQLADSLSEGRDEDERKTRFHKIAMAVVCAAVVGGLGIVWHVSRLRSTELKVAAAVAKYRARAEHGDATAQYELGGLYYRHKGVPLDYDEAVRWYRKSADQGYAKAEYALGFMYHNGRGVPYDDAEAVRWFRKAADQGDAEAQHSLALAFYYDKGISENDAEASAWFGKAAEQGYAPAQSYLGFMYYHAQGVPQDKAEALRWYRKAGEQNDERLRLPSCCWITGARDRRAITLRRRGGLAKSRVRVLSEHKWCEDAGPRSLQSCSSCRFRRCAHSDGDARSGYPRLLCSAGCAAVLIHQLLVPASAFDRFFLIPLVAAVAILYGIAAIVQVRRAPRLSGR